MIRPRDIVDAFYDQPEVFYQHRGISQLLKHKRVLKIVFLFLTKECNKACAYCFVQKAANSEMPLAIIDKMIHDIQELKRKPQINLIGGEPLLHSRFQDICRSLSRSNIPFSITTNGSLLGKHIEMLSMQKSLRTLYISIHEGTYESLLPIAVHLQNLCSRVRIVLQITVHFLLAQSNPIVFLESLARMQPSSIVIKHSQTVFLFQEKLAWQELERLIAVRSILNVPLLFSPKISQKQIKAYYVDRAYPGKKPRCVFPWLALQVFSSGSIYSCSHFSGSPLGSLRKNSLLDVWRSWHLYIQQFSISLLRGYAQQEACRRCCWREYD